MFALLCFILVVLTVNRRALVPPRYQSNHILAALIGVGASPVIQQAR
jgi:hypothetical protein